MTRIGCPGSASAAPTTAVAHGHWHACAAACLILVALTACDKPSAPKDAAATQSASRQDTAASPQAAEDEAAGPYGAIAVATDGLHAGLSYDKASVAAAEAAAVATCESSAKGKRLGCKSQVWFERACGALAMGDEGAFGTGWGHDPRSACRWALKTCRDFHGKNCEPNFYACSPGKRSGTCDGTLRMNN